MTWILFRASAGSTENGFIQALYFLEKLRILRGEQPLTAQPQSRRYPRTTPGPKERLRETKSNIE
jgi:hypothetical protein